MSILINSDGTWKDVTGGGGGTGIQSISTILSSYALKVFRCGNLVQVCIDGRGTYTGLPKPVCELSGSIIQDVFVSGNTTVYRTEWSLSTDGKLTVTYFYTSHVFMYICTE